MDLDLRGYPGPSLRGNSDSLLLGTLATLARTTAEWQIRRINLAKLYYGGQRLDDFFELLLRHAAPAINETLYGDTANLEGIGRRRLRQPVLRRRIDANMPDIRFKGHIPIRDWCD